MIQIGQYAEAFGNSYPSIKELISNEPIPEKSAILEYLNRGIVFAASPAILKDAVSGDIINANLVAMNDGTYTWRSDLIYYFDKYNFALPKEFIKHVLEKIE